MIKKEQYIKNISQALSILSSEVELLNCVNLYDINIIAEDFYAKLLNKIYGYNLYNLNAYEKNAPAIDLVDDVKELTIQVTSDNSSKKIKETIKKFIENKQYLKYKKLYILILTSKKKYSATFNTNNLFDFNEEHDIIDKTDLIKYIKNIKDNNQICEISDILDEELVFKIQKTKKTQASEVDTIIDLIEFITNNREFKEKRNTITDPEYKIEKRFKEFADTLKNNFISLYSIYGEALILINNNLEIDSAQELITIMYLQDISIRILDECDNNPLKALDQLVNFFEEKLSKNGKKYDRAAIKFYLINELIKCNIFPNEGGIYENDKK